MERLNELSKQAHESAVKRGFWSENLSTEHYLMLVITEIAEMVEADRENKRANMWIFYDWQENDFSTFTDAFEKFVKNTVEDEMADVAIRLLDLAGGIGCTEIKGTFPFEIDSFTFHEYKFTEIAHSLIINRLLQHNKLLEERIANSLFLLFDWANYLNVDLFKHIELKMKYNETREFKHGKRY